MEYTLLIPEPLGDFSTLHSVADAMAKKRANTSGAEFHKPAYEGSFPQYMSMLIEDAKNEKLQVCDQFGFQARPSQLVDARRRQGTIIESPNDPNLTIALNVYVNLYQLNIWAKERGDVFHITHDGVPWVDERGWFNVEGLQPPPLEMEARETQKQESRIVSAAVECASEGVKPTSARLLSESTSPKYSVTKAALIAQHKHEWPTVERDIRDASVNGLSKAAKAGARDWYETEALDWARSKNKLIAPRNPEPLNNLMRHLPSQKITRS